MKNQLPVKASYKDLSAEEQISYLEKKAFLAAQKFGLKVHSIKCVRHGFNTTFKIKSGHSFYAMRLGLNSNRSLKNIRVEHRWMKMLSDEGIAVPELKEALDGKTLVVLPKDHLLPAIPVTLMEWLKGKELDKTPKKIQLKMIEDVGRETALLHMKSKKMQKSVSRGAEVLDGVFWSRPNRIKGFHKTLPQYFSFEKQKVFNSLTRNCEKVVKKYWKNDEGILIHGDLHFGNIYFSQNKISIIDFDDCGMSIPLWDIAITLFYLVPEKNFKSYFERYMMWYQRVMDLPIDSPHDLKDLMIGRGLMLLNDIVSWENADVQKRLPSIIKKIEKRIVLIQKIDFEKLFHLYGNLE